MTPEKSLQGAGYNRNGSLGRLNALLKNCPGKGIFRDLMVVSHGSMGFAEAVDGEKDFVDPLATAPRGSYRDCRGLFSHRIDLSLLPAYGFDFSMGRMLYEEP